MIDTSKASMFSDRQTSIQYTSSGFHNKTPAGVQKRVRRLRAERINGITTTTLAMKFGSADTSHQTQLIGGATGYAGYAEAHPNSKSCIKFYCHIYMCFVLIMQWSTSLFNRTWAKKEV